MMRTELLLAAALALPIAMLAACLSRTARTRMPALLGLAPLPALAAALLAPTGSMLVLPDALLGLTFALDPPGAMLLGVAALLWAAAGVYASAMLHGAADVRHFAVWWLVTLVGNLGVFVAADLVSFFVFFTLSSLAGWGLIVHDATVAARRAGAVYIGLALLGEALLLIGLVLVAAGSRGLVIRDAVAALPTSPWRDAALLFLILGFGLKVALVPLHVWMPLAYAAAPIPAAAVLSGAAVKAGVIGLIRFLPFETGLPAWGAALAAIGFISAFYGAIIGLTQTNPKTVLAYSSISQMGLLAAVIGMGLAAADRSTEGAAAFYAVHHVLAKGGLFLAVGLASLPDPRRSWLVLLPAAVISLGLAGLPPTGGMLAKWGIKAPLGGGLAGVLATLSAIASTVLMLHFLRCLHRQALHDGAIPAPPARVLAWLVIAIASLALPWTLHAAAGEASWRDVLTPSAFWEALWPIVVGGALGVLLQHSLRPLPTIPAGDLLAAAPRALPPVQSLAAAIERIDVRLRQWPVAGTLLAALAIALAASLLGR
jgi:formate hydrogenlyase subunit 3/multisubunit Na+/H+ antiporter MnhD subunit